MRFLPVLILLASHSLYAQSVTAQLKPLQVSIVELKKDLGLIEADGLFKHGTLSLGKVEDATASSVRIECRQDTFAFHVKAPAGEKTSALYKAVRELGFLFPHPRHQISPTLKQMKKSCGKQIAWRPALKYRGSHLHNLHPNEWVHGFFLNKPEVAEQTVRWLARNGQNLLDMSLVRIPLDTLKAHISPAYALARSLEIHTGVSLGLAFTQQKSYKLISIFQAATGWKAEQSIEEGLNKLFKALPLSFVVLEAGTSEFTPISYEKTRDWLNLSARIAQAHQVALFTKVHVSTNQHHEKWGNYNFLPQHAEKNVGILAHTVMFYGLLDAKAPMYGNVDFSGMRKFIEQQNSQRPTWYYPETSYWVGMDVDIPLLLTEYLRSRAEDYQWLHQHGVEGHLNFTTGHALGGWLLDWNLALINDLDYKFDPMTALKLLGEPEKVWQAHMKFQKEWIKEKGLIAFLSAANLQDELTEAERIHTRNTMKQLSHSPSELKREIQLLQEGLKHWPSWNEVKNKELRDLLHVTWQRHNHALNVRLAIQNPDQKEEYLKKAQIFREQMQAIVKGLSTLPTNYPDLPLFVRHVNPTSYQFGYVYTAATGYFWEREERQIRTNSFFPFTDTIYDVFSILF